MFRPVLSLLCPALVATALVGCSGPTATDQAGANALHRGNEAEPESLDPHAVRSVAAQNIMRDLGEGLVTFGAAGDLVPGAARSWSVSEDGLHYRFDLRTDARWSNGDPVTAADFVTGFRRLMNPATGAFYGELLGDIRAAADILRGDKLPDELGIQAVGDQRLHIELTRPAAHFLELLALPATFPIHRPTLEEHGKGFARAGRLVTNGAYRLAEWRVGSHIRLERNPHYREAANTAIETVWYYPTVDQMAELNRYRAGELHITANVPTQAFARLHLERPAELKVAPYLNTYYYGFNLTRPPFAENPGLRRALSMVIDRELLVREVTRRGEQPARGWIPPGLPRYQPQRVDYASWPRDQRLEEARRLYREAGYSQDKPLRTEIRFNTDRGHQQIAVAIQSMWKTALGVEAQLINEELKVHLARVRERADTQVFRASWVGDYSDPNTFAALFKSDNPANLTGYANPAYDALLERAAATRQQDQRMVLLQEAEAMMLADAPLIPIYFYVSKHLVHRTVTGWRAHALDHHPTRYLALQQDH